MQHASEGQSSQVFIFKCNAILCPESALEGLFLMIISVSITRELAAGHGAFPEKDLVPCFDRSAALCSEAFCTLSEKQKDTGMSHNSYICNNYFENNKQLKLFHNRSDVLLITQNI